jgi:hypothetical protein
MMHHDASNNLQDSQLNCCPRTLILAGHGSYLVGHTPVLLLCQNCQNMNSLSIACTVRLGRVHQIEVTPFTLIFFGLFVASHIDLSYQTFYKLYFLKCKQCPMLYQSWARRLVANYRYRDH